MIVKYKLKELIELKVFPFDDDTLSIIREIETYLGLRNVDINKMNYADFTEYIDQIVLMLLK